MSELQYVRHSRKFASGLKYFTLKLSEQSKIVRFEAFLVFIEACKL